MFKDIFKHEINSWLRKPVTYIYFLGFFGFALLTFIGTAGFFDPPPNDTTKLTRVINSSYELNYMLQYFTKIFMFLLPAIIGVAIYKDYKYNMHSIIYTFPIDKTSYLFGKFLSAFCIVVLISFSVGLAFLVGEFVPGLHESKMGSLSVYGYVQAYLVYVIPTLFFFGAIIFAVVTLTRNIYAGFITVIVIFLFQLIIENALGGTGQVYLMSVLDPFAQNTKEYAIQNWTLIDKNTKLLPISVPVILNRLFWLACSFLTLKFLFYKFSFSEHPPNFLFKKQKGNAFAKENFGSVTKVSISKVGYDFSWRQQLKAIGFLSMIDLKYIVKNWMFLILVFFGVLAVIFAIAKVTNFEEIAMLPTTKVVLTIPALFFTMIMIITTFLYAGMLVHRSRTTKMEQLIDVTPISNGVFLFSKVLALMKMQCILLLILMVSGISIQLYNGYYNFEIGLYLFQLYALTFPVLIIWSFAAVCIQTVFTNTYLGLFVLIIGWIGISGLPQAGITEKLLLFNAPPKTDYSDMNGYAEALMPYFLVEGYWLSFGSILLILAFLLWIRGLPQSFKERLQIARARFNKPMMYVLGVALLCFTALGFTIHTAEKKVKWGTTSSEDQKNVFENFKKTFERYDKVVQPRITSMKLQLDIFPETNSFKANGSYVLVNKSIEAIDTLLVKTGFDEITTLELDGAYKTLAEDTLMKFKVIKLAKTILPGDSTQLNFTVRNTENTLFERNSNVLQNGSFLLNDLFPRLGYSFSEEQNHPGDSVALLNNYGAIDSDLIAFEAVVSTSKDQIALAPGYPVKEWEENDRRYFQYKTGNKIKYVMGFNSGRFEIRREKYKGVELEVYHHKKHPYNLDEMMNGLKAALDYNTRYFAPYQHRQARIIEFPDSEGTYATTMANSIPMSEIRFIANTNTADEKVDLAFYVAAHELTHQWWGNQVAGADALGARMLSESITELITLNIYKERYGEEVALQFLKMQRERYLEGRRTEQEKEPPLMLAGEQLYLFYGKGAMAFNTMSHYLGEKKLNRVLKQFLEDYRLQEEPPYPTSLELIERLKQATPDSLQYVINDVFETVTFYDNKIENVKVSSTGKDTYEVELDFSIRKYADGADKDILPLNDYIEIGVYDDSGKPIHLKKYKVHTLKNKLRIRTGEKAERVVIDPNFLLLDKNIADNNFALGEF
ncbi:M1 family aminopeptidase [Maribacter sp.]|nr:M1 family aminopeptidase [Maribacter sp.]